LKKILLRVDIRLTFSTLNIIMILNWHQENLGKQRWPISMQLSTRKKKNTINWDLKLWSKFRSLKVKLLCSIQNLVRRNKKFHRLKSNLIRSSKWKKNIIKRPKEQFSTSRKHNKEFREKKLKWMRKLTELKCRPRKKKISFKMSWISWGTEMSSFWMKFRASE
jgi:hypothetical protein